MHRHLIFFLLALSPLTAAAESPELRWPAWRGADASGSAQDGDYPAKLLGPSLLWQRPLPGKGTSTPIVWGDRIFLSGAENGRELALALDWEGKELWRTPHGEERPGKHRNGSGSNPSPVTDGQRLFVYFKSGTLAALDLEGKALWQTNLQERWNKDTLYWDLGTSPVLTKKHVVVAVLQGGGSYLAAFDQVTGELAWKVDRTYPTPPEGDNSYATPIVLERDGKEVIVVCGAEHLTAHDAADGSLLWERGEFNPEKSRNWVVVASFVTAGDVAVVPYGRGKALHGVSLKNGERLWKREDDAGAFVPSPVVYGGKVYVLRDRGGVECLDPATGQTLWTGEFPRASASYYASPTIAGGKLYAAREDGMLFVAKIEGGFEVLSENNFKEPIIASPVPVKGRLLVRSESSLYCFGNTP